MQWAWGCSERSRAGGQGAAGLWVTTQQGWRLWGSSTGGYNTVGLGAMGQGVTAEPCRGPWGSGATVLGD